MKKKENTADSLKSAVFNNKKGNRFSKSNYMINENVINEEKKRDFGLKKKILRIYQYKKEVKIIYTQEKMREKTDI